MHSKKQMSCSQLCFTPRADLNNCWLVQLIKTGEAATIWVAFLISIVPASFEHCTFTDQVEEAIVISAGQLQLHTFSYPTHHLGLCVLQLQLCLSFSLLSRLFIWTLLLQPLHSAWPLHSWLRTSTTSWRSSASPSDIPKAGSFSLSKLMTREAITLDLLKEYVWVPLDMK